VKTQQINN